MKKFTIKTVENEVQHSEPNEWIDLELSPRDSTCNKCGGKIHKYRLRVTHLSQIRGNLFNTKYHNSKCAPRELLKQLKDEPFHDDAESNILNAIEEAKKKLQKYIRARPLRGIRRPTETNYNLVKAELDSTITEIRGSKTKKRKPKTVLRRYAFISKRS